MGDAVVDQLNSRNQTAWQHWSIWPRPLQSFNEANTTCCVLGEQWAHPIMLAPVAYQRLFHAEGEIGSAMACHAQDGQMMVSSLASQKLDHIQAAAAQPLWFQLYWQGNRADTWALCQQAIAAGYCVIVLTVDAPVKTAVLDLTPDITAVNLRQPLRPRSLTVGQSLVFDGWMSQAPTWADVAWLRTQLHVPLLIKGLMHMDDVQQAVGLGCEGIVLSNHGGRVLGSAPTVASLLPAMSKAIAGQALLVVDSGIRSGEDVFKAIALGADVVCIGRPYVWGLAAEGAMGVAKVIRTLRDELEMTMALAGVTSLMQIKHTSLLPNHALNS